jgi:hypothetical protein
MPHVLVWDIETIPDLRDFAATNGLGGNDAIFKLKCSEALPTATERSSR